MANYISSISALVGAECARLPRAVLFGENVNNGSRIVGICRHLTVPEGGKILNVGNCEATHVGAGFGLMLNGIHSVLFAKQYDFMLLAVDHFVNTYNFIRASRTPETLGAFTIVSVVCDQGYQGPQSSFNSLGDLCSLGRIPGFVLTNAQDSPRILRAELGKPGFRLIALSQRMFTNELLDPGIVWAASDHSLLQYSEGSDATIVCYNFAIPEGHVLQAKLRLRGLNASLFSANYVFPIQFDRICQSVSRTGRLIVMDDSKSTNLCAHRLMHEVAAACPRSKRILVDRGVNVEFGLSDDVLAVDYDAISFQMSKPLAA